jgi:hypothetical protein
MILSAQRSRGLDHASSESAIMDLHRQPPQQQIPDDLVPNRAGYSNDQLAIRTLAEVVAQLVMHGEFADTARRVMLATLADVYLLTEPRD